MAPVIPDPGRIRAFESPKDFYVWLAEHHASETELWLKIFKKNSAVPTINWQQAVTVGLCWGWIDGIKKSFDEQAFLQRFSPRRKNSLWSMVNRLDAERLIEAKEMQPAGMFRVEEARANGRWDNAYLGSKEAEIPADFLQQISKNSVAQATFATLNRQNLYAIYSRLQTASNGKIRANRMAKLIETLDRGEVFH